MINPDIVIVPTIFAVPAIVTIVILSFRHRERMAALHNSPAREAALERRLERIEQAIETIAVEVERMGEGQRFVTKLLAAREPTALESIQSKP